MKRIGQEKRGIWLNMLWDMKLGSDKIGQLWATDIE